MHLTPLAWFVFPLAPMHVSIPLHDFNCLLSMHDVAPAATEGPGHVPPCRGRPILRFSPTCNLEPFAVPGFNVSGFCPAQAASLQTAPIIPLLSRPFRLFKGKRKEAQRRRKDLGEALQKRTPETAKPPLFAHPYSCSPKTYFYSPIVSLRMVH